MEDGLTFEWRGVRTYRGRRVGSLWVYRGGVFLRSVVGFLGADESEACAEDRMRGWAIK